MNTILITIKKIIPTQLFHALQPAYHYTLNILAALVYRFPSRSMIVIGITGTTGKTTITFLLAHLLRHAGLKVGYTSTALLSDGEHDWLNDQKMTMLGRFFTQKMLARMRANHCDIAIVETTSEGIVQYRHRFINYDTLLFTGIYPEHIVSHGGFENYKQAKLRLFHHLAHCAKKTINGKMIRKTIIANGDDEHAAAFLRPWAEDKRVFTQRQRAYDTITPPPIEKLYTITSSNSDGIALIFDGTQMHSALLGAFSATNIAAAASVAEICGLTRTQIVDGVRALPDVPGRLERITAPAGFTVIVDYAFEPVAMTKLYEIVKTLNPKKVIHVLGGTGGGRDRARRPKLGAIAAKNADTVIITNEDPYDEDPRQIMEDVARGVRQAGKKPGKHFQIIDNRKDAIKKALTLAQKGDIVLITGKGSEQSICIADGKKTPHDDRTVVREALLQGEKPHEEK